MCMIPVMTDTILAEENARLKARLAETEAALAGAVEAQKRLESIVSELRREKFGRKSEKLDPEQFNLPLEDIEVAQGVLEAAQEKARDALKGKGAGKGSKANRNRGHLPKHLPRLERIIEPETTLCPCGCGEMARIGEDVSERLDVVPAQFRVIVARRPKYACRRCSGAVVQAHAPEHVVPGGLPTEALIAQVMVAKFGDHIPFYRQAEIYARQGITLDRATLGNWVGRACFHLRPIADHLRERLKSADRIFMDETRAPVLDPGRRKTKTSYFWAIVSDDRGHGGADPPIVMFHYAPGRGAVHALRFLEGYRGHFVQCDGYDAYDKLTRVERPEGPWTLVHCWTHARRRFVKRLGKRRLSDRRGGVASDRRDSMLSRKRFVDPHRKQGSPRGASSPHRSSRPSAPGLKPSYRASRSPPNWPKTSDTPWRTGPGLTRFLEDGRLELDTNPVENQIRKIALTRKNALFAGQEVGAENWALLASLIANCKMCDIDPVSYLTNTLQALLDGHPKSRIDELMPSNFEAASSRAA